MSWESARRAPGAHGERAAATAQDLGKALAQLRMLCGRPIPVPPRFTSAGKATPPRSALGTWGTHRSSLPSPHWGLGRGPTQRAPLGSEAARVALHRGNRPGTEHAGEQNRRPTLAGGDRARGSPWKLPACPWPAPRVGTCLSGKSRKGKMLWLTHFMLKITSLSGMGCVSFL